MNVRELRKVSVSQIDCEAQVRSDFAEAGLVGLAQSLTAVGLQQPILLRAVADRFVVIDGERRLRAAKRAGWKEIEAIVEEAVPTEPERILKQLVSNCQRQNLSPIETARAIEQLMAKSGCTAAEAASKIGSSAPTCSKLLSLLTLPDEIRALLHTDRLATSAGYEIAKTKDPKRRAQLIARALKGALTREAAARGSRGRKGKAKRPRVVIPVGEGRTLAITGPDLRLAVLIEIIEAAAARLRSLQPSLAGEDLEAALGASEEVPLSANGRTKSRAKRGELREPAAGAVGES
jgi:ParB/RepB/Spo0J family partition protein